MKHRIILLLGVLLPFLAIGLVQADKQEILLLRVSDPISPAVAEFVVDGLQQASDSSAAAIIITLDTPGGLSESMRQIVQAIYACKAPVIVYVTPSGARAASAGMMITMAADIAAMTPGTNIGAAHPVNAGGGDLAKTMAEKIVNDMAAFVRGIADRRGRNVQWAEKAVRSSVSVTAEEALKLGVIDLVANNLDDLIGKLEGKTVKDKGILHLEGARRTVIQESLRIKILKTISDPNIAYILLMIGLAGLFLELSHPGAVLPGVVGGISLILAFFAMQTLPVNTAGILLILLAIIFFVLELKISSYGMLSVAGITSLVLGSTMLFRGAGPQFQVAWAVLLPTVILISGFFIGVIYLVVRAQTRKPRTGAEGLTGEIGIVKQINGRKGKILVHGELWQAVFTDEVSLGDKVCVQSVQNLVVTTAPVKEQDV
jgi:membrane-bound serine protease (ClpP class)